MYTTRPIISGHKGVLASGHYLATQAGLKMFARGGNAIDAGVAAGFALTVLKPQENSLGGECPILIYAPDQRRVVAINGQGVAPKRATLQWFQDHDIQMIPGDGYLGATVPALFASYCTALATFGRLTLHEVLEPAMEIAADGFPIYEGFHSVLQQNRQRFLDEWPSSAAVYLPGGEVPLIGTLQKQPALAHTFQRLIDAEQAGASRNRVEAIQLAIDLFYHGKITEQIMDFTTATPVRDASGDYHTPLLSGEDFAQFSTHIEVPVSVNYHDKQVFKCGPWTQGPVLLHQLKLLEGFPLSTMEHGSAQHLHTVVECAKLAFADRDRYYGDPAFTDVPLDYLLSTVYNKELRQRINSEHANNSPLWDEAMVALNDQAYIGDTTHLDVADAEGYFMSATPSGGWIPTSPVIPDVGFPLGTRAQLFDLRAGHPNCIMPGKRPRTTLTPSLAFQHGIPYMAFGTPGGDMQDQWSLQFFLNVTDFGMNLQQAIDAPSFHTTHFVNSFYPKVRGDGTIYVEEGISLMVLRELQALGHKITLLPAHSNGEVCAVTRDANGQMSGAASSKGSHQAYAMGW